MLSRHAGRVLAPRLRYEVRRGHDGVISNINEAVASAERLTDDVVVAERLRHVRVQARIRVRARTP